MPTETNPTDSLITEINKLIEAKTFSLDAAPAIAALKEKATKLEERNDWLDKSLKHEQMKTTQLDAKVSDLQTEIANRDKREADLLKRETEITKLERDTAVARAEKDATLSVVGMFLRNTTVRESVVSKVPVATQGSASSMGYVTQYDSSQTTETTKE